MLLVKAKSKVKINFLLVLQTVNTANEPGYINLCFAFVVQGRPRSKSGRITVLVLVKLKPLTPPYLFGKMKRRSDLFYKFTDEKMTTSRFWVQQNGKTFAPSGIRTRAHWIAACIWAPASQLQLTPPCLQQVSMVLTLIANGEILSRAWTWPWNSHGSVPIMLLCDKKHVKCYSPMFDLVIWPRPISLQSATSGHFCSAIRVSTTLTITKALTQN